jgi:hypothetical protein
MDTNAQSPLLFRRTPGIANAVTPAADSGKRWARARMLVHVQHFTTCRCYSWFVLVMVFAASPLSAEAH